MRTLGIDPGTYNMGVGIVASEGSALRYVDADVLKAPRGTSLAHRLHCLHAALLEYIARHKPSDISIEEPFVARNVRSAIAVGQAQAVAMIAAAASGISVTSFAPREIKLAVTGFGDSSKEQVQEMVILALGANTPSLALDASDALAVAICAVHSRNAESLTVHRSI